MKTLNKKSNIRHATKEILMKTIPDISDIDAEKIIKYVHNNGQMKDLKDLNSIKDINKKHIQMIQEKFSM